MVKKELFDYLTDNNIKFRLLNENEGKEIIQKIVSIAGGEILHYLWSNYKSDNFIAQKKISCDKDIYIQTLNNVLIFEDMFLIIDKTCINNLKNDIVFELSKPEILKIMYEFYWNLDEIYISDLNFNCFVSVNHNFEISLYGDKKSDLCRKVVKKFK
ncbi:MAG: hypothetical protein HDT23_07510 [Ruminococcus sp.]|nr:hypothetical protein [Ruminococcus sp.]